jgi:glycosyltransferase involved in cell wall biosynthesis
LISCDVSADGVAPRDHFDQDTRACMKRAFINGRFLTQRLTGVQRYALETLRALDELLADETHELGRDLELTVLAPPGTSAPPLRRIGFRTVGPLAGNAWEQLTLPWACRGELLISFGPTGPALKKRQVVTIHDAAVHVVPEAFSWKFRLWYRLLLPILARRNPRVMTVSNFAKQEVVRFFGADAERVRVSGEGWQHFARVSSDASILARHGLVPGRYVLAVSSITPHKNFAVVARALRSLTAPDFDVVVTGGNNGKVFGHIDTSTLAGLKLVGYVSDGELRALYENAAAFVHPSLYEGFGIPPLEAMAMGCPVIASDAAAIPEVCGDAALYFSPRDADALAALMSGLVSDTASRARLVERGRERTARYSWRDAALCHLEGVHEALQGARPDARPAQ